MIKDIEKLIEINLIKQNKIEYTLSLLEQDTQEKVKQRSLIASKIKSNYKSVYTKEAPSSAQGFLGLGQTFQNFENWKTSARSRITALTQEITALDAEKETLRTELKASIVQDNILASLQAKMRAKARDRKLDIENERVLGLRSLLTLDGLNA